MDPKEPEADRHDEAEFDLPEIPGWALLRLIEEEGHSLVEHLAELRVRLVISLSALLVASVYGWTLIPEVIEFLRSSVGRLIFIAPTEAFFTRLKIAVTVGLLISSPIITFQAWRFVLPALFPHERSALRWVIWAGAFLFICGLLFGIFVVYPVSLKFFLSFGTDNLRAAIVVSRHLGFFLGTTITFGIAFQLPLALLVLVRLGVTTSERLREMRKTALFLAFVVAAALTPADAISHLMMAAPLAVLYEVTVRIAPRFERREPGRPPAI